ncbi:uncharacterized protein LOC100212533 isoform X2 [Hydra vulgaris]|uniref:uncharacterized protein LOC100212533 isoform X2 n=1 Tax=Hydra vulgaris TaxID=6087 RepID=UPI001F5F7BBE|nr:uncharacterized protein LOC100212533 isoform X2 [Hydra vulgaris]
MSYNQQVPCEDDGTMWIFSEHSYTSHETENSLMVWNEIQDDTKRKVDNEIRSFRERIQHLLAEQRLQSEYLLGIYNNDVYKDLNNEVNKKVPEREKLSESTHRNHHSQVPSTQLSNNVFLDSEYSTFNSDIDNFSDGSLISNDQLIQPGSRKYEFIARILAATIRIHNAISS